jgi:hypothetical protein
MIAALIVLNFDDDIKVLIEVLLLKNRGIQCIFSNGFSRREVIMKITAIITHHIFVRMSRGFIPDLG